MSVEWKTNKHSPKSGVGFPGGSGSKESACSAGDLGSAPELGRSPGEGNSYPLQYSELENSRDGIVHGVSKSQTQLSDFHQVGGDFSCCSPWIIK